MQRARAYPQVSKSNLPLRLFEVNNVASTRRVDSWKRSKRCTESTPGAKISRSRHESAYRHLLYQDSTCTISAKADEFGPVPPWAVPAVDKIYQAENRFPTVSDQGRLTRRYAFYIVIANVGEEFGRVRRTGILDPLRLAGKQSSEEIEGPSCPSATYLL